MTLLIETRPWRRKEERFGKCIVVTCTLTSQLLGISYLLLLESNSILQKTQNYKSEMSCLRYKVLVMIRLVSYICGFHCVLSSWMRCNRYHTMTGTARASLKIDWLIVPSTIFFTLASWPFFNGYTAPCVLIEHLFHSWFFSSLTFLSLLLSRYLMQTELWYHVQRIKQVEHSGFSQYY